MLKTKKDFLVMLEEENKYQWWVIFLILAYILDHVSINKNRDSLGIIPLA